MSQIDISIDCVEEIAGEEIESIANVFTEFKVQLQERGISSGCIDLVRTVELSLVFILAQYFSGFFSEAGKVTWNKFSNVIGSFYKRQQDEKKFIVLKFYLVMHNAPVTVTYAVTELSKLVSNRNLPGTGPVLSK